MSARLINLYDTDFNTIEVVFQNKLAEKIWDDNLVVREADAPDGGKVIIKEWPAEIETKLNSLLQDLWTIGLTFEKIELFGRQVPTLTLIKNHG